MRRVLIIGSGGAGKSTLAERLAKRTGLPLIHLDSLFWHAGWIPTPDAEWDAVVDELITRDAWIMDGNYGRTLHTRLAAADTVIFLDMPRLTCLWRIIKRRWVEAGRNRPSLPEGCPETIGFEFIWWVLTYPNRRRPGILAQLEGLKGRARVIILRTNAAVETFLAGL